MNPLHVVAILSLSTRPVAPSSTTDDATATATSDDAQPPATDEDPDTSPASAEEIPASEPDPFDESTWEGLTVEQKDELRAQRARLQAKAADERAREQTKDRTNAREALRRMPRSNRALELYEERDVRLRRATIGLATTFGVTTVLTGVLAGIRSSRINFHCAAPVPDPTNPVAPDTSSYDRCLDWVERGNQLAVPVGLLATSAVLSMVGTIVVGTVWGNHRNNRAVLELGWLGSRMARRR